MVYITKRSIFPVQINEAAKKQLKTAQKVKCSVQDFFSKCEKMCCFLWISLHLLKKSLTETFIF